AGTAPPGRPCAISRAACWRRWPWSCSSAPRVSWRRRARRWAPSAVALQACRRERGGADSRRRLRPRHRLDLRAHGPRPRDHLQRHAHAQLRAGRDADGVDVRGVGGPAGAGLAAGGEPRRRRRDGGRDGVGDRARGDPPCRRRHALGRPHHHPRPVTDPAFGRGPRLDARRVSLPVVLRQPTDRARPRTAGAGLARHHRGVAVTDGGPVCALQLDAAGPGRAEEGVTARARRGLLAALAVGLAAWPWVAPRYFVFLASLIFVNVVVALGLNLLSGYTNQLSFGHAGFLAIGAYTAALV